MNQYIAMARQPSYISAKDACHRLGVKAATLYAYVSRGLIRCESRPGDKRKLYLRSDVDRLVARSRARAGHGAVAASAMRWGEPVLDSAITLIQGGKLYYHGLDVQGLVRAQVTFEQVAELLWSGVLPQDAVTWPAVDAPTDMLINATWPMRAAHVLTGAKPSLDRASDPIDVTLATARRMIRKLAATVHTAGKATATGASIAHSLFRNPTDAQLGAANAALVVCADHELNASTFATRVVASTNADITSCFLGALGALAGPRHGASTTAVETLLTTFSNARAARAACKSLLDAGRAVPGFGHTLYPDGDPRYQPLVDAARTCRPRSAGAQTCERVDLLVDTMHSLGGPLPSLDVALVFANAALDLLPGGAIALFGLGRSAGWTAHILEQRRQDFMLRPRARYVGRPPSAREPDEMS